MSKDDEKERGELVFIEASDNLYADAGDPDAEAMQTKALLTCDIYLTLKRLRMSEQRAAALLDIPQAELAKVMLGEFRYISTETVADYLARIKTLPG
jgi:predicted XRE-type DNA-binding protein